MLKSMTGYGSAESVFKDGRIAIEVKSVNHRYIDISCRIPKSLPGWEGQARNVISERFSRGRFDVFVQLDSNREKVPEFQLNIPLAQQYFSILKELRDELDLSGEIDVDMLTRVKDIITVKEVESDLEGEEQAFLEALNTALDSLERMRVAEGEVLYGDLFAKLNNIERFVHDIRDRSPQVLIDYKEKLEKRVKELSSVVEFDIQRLNQEIAFLAERSDITEELVRIGSHIKQFATMMKMNEPVGRKLDFLLQEINREINTIASKANDAEISQKVVEVKTELEKIKEQAHNIE